jgi:hypothetical protein
MNNDQILTDPISLDNWSRRKTRMLTFILGIIVGAGSAELFRLVKTSSSNSTPHQEVQVSAAQVASPSTNSDSSNNIIVVGVRLDPRTGITHLGLAELGKFLDTGARVTKIEPGDTYISKGTGDENMVTLRLAGFALQVHIVEPR